MRGIATLWAALVASAGAFADVTPQEVFLNPPKEAHAGVWWHWMGGQVSREGIEKDLDWFSRMGITSVTIFGMADTTVPWAKRIANIPTGIHPYDDEWWALVKFACAEGKKRGIDIGLHNCPGYTSTGGTWIPPHLAMRKLVFGVKDPEKDIPLAAEAPSPVYDEEKGVFGKPDCPLRRTDYQPIAVVRGIAVGHIPCGSYIQPADWGSFGLECDKMNPEAVEFHLDHVIAEWKKHLGDDLRSAGLQHILLDSYEAGRPTWTPHLREEFKSRRGYDCLDFLPILGGYTNLYTEAECEKFKKDFDRTIQDLYRDVLFKIMHERLAAEGLQFNCEPYNGPWVIAEVAPHIDRIMTEFWHRPGKPTRVIAKGNLFNTYKSPQGERHNIVEAEAFTSAARWVETPGSLKANGDHAWLQGVNRFVLHSCVHQPWGDDVKPGVTMGRWGTHFGRNQTWGESGKAWFDYIARSQALLQWGRPATGRLKLPFGEIARTDGKLRVHFLVNESDEEKPLALPSGGRWFDPVTGEIGKAPATLAPHQSGFYELNVSRRGAERWRAASDSQSCPETEIESWEPALGDWTKSENPEMRYFSGTMTYRATFDRPNLCDPAPLRENNPSIELDLGTVFGATARVRLNGRDLGIVWCAPWRVKIPEGVLKEAGNVLEIDVTNTWRNRLIGDELEPPDVAFAKAPYPGGDMMLSYPGWFKDGIAARPSKNRKCFATWNYFTPKENDNALMPSGLVGPVTIRKALRHPRKEAKVSRPVPRKALLSRLAEGVDVIAICHFGLNTYTDKEWGYGDDAPALFNPDSFDAEQIVNACKDGGIKGIVVVAKHHDGFCLWPTKTTDYNITKSPFRDGKGDYVREMSEACRKAGLKFGVYVSPWDRHDADYATEKYVEKYHAQIKELLGGGYGEVFEMWFDGANGGGGFYGGANEKRTIGKDYYRFGEVFRFVRELQPTCCIFAEDDDSDFRYPGNERGMLSDDSRATVVSCGGLENRKFLNPDYPRWKNKGKADGDRFRVCEADFPLRKGWFYHERERGTTKNAAYLAKLYCGTVGNGGTMNIGIAPDADGRLDEEDVRTLKGFKTLVDALFAHEAKDGEVFNVVVMKEDIAQGENIDGWRIVADGREVFSGNSIGAKRIRLLVEPVAAKDVRLEITRGTGNVIWHRYYATPELVKAVLAADADSGETDTAKWMEGRAKERSGQK